jgi:hypothetical protein
LPHRNASESQSSEAMGESMSEAPQRSDAEKYKIAIEANRRRENISASSGDDVSDWLEAEAFLQASGEITRRPIALPFELLFTSVDITAPQPRAEFLSLLPSDDGPAPRPAMARTKITDDGGSSPNSPILLGTDLIAHDSRLVGLQIAALIAAVDRISRFIDWVATEPFPDVKFFDQFQEDDETFYQLRESYRDALFEPDLHADTVQAIDTAIRNHSFAVGVAADVRNISLGSFVEITLALMAMDWNRAMIGIAILGGTSFVSSLGVASGTGLGKVLARIDHLMDKEPRPVKGIRGRITATPARQRKDFVEAVDRDYRNGVKVSR